MRCASIVYLPSPTDSRFHTQAFLKNLRANPPAGDLILFSDHVQPDAPECIRLKGTVELESLKNAKIQRPGTGEITTNKAAINNLVFLTALRIVERQGYTHYCYLEEDVRVRNHDEAWDTRVFKEFFEQSRHLIAAGSIVIYNPANHDRVTLERFERFVTETKAAGRKMPLPVYGWLSAQSGQGVCAFTNGAGSIFSVAGLKMLFPERITPENEGGKSDPDIAAGNWAWDLTIGSRLFNKFKGDIYELLGYLPSVYSTYGDVLSSQEERLALLDQGFAITHQIKSDK